MTSITFRFTTSGSWSGGGGSLLGLAEYAAQLHPVFADSELSVPIIPRNSPSRAGLVERPFVLAPQNAWPWSHPDWRLPEIPRVLALRAASAVHMRRASAVLRISSAIPVVGSSDRYSPVVHNVLDPGFETALAESAHVDAGAAEGRIVCIGSVVSYRNLRRVIEAHQKSDDLPELLICGPIATQAVANEVGTLALDSRRVTVKWGALTRAECLAYFRAADCVILPSMVEASPFTLLEALAVQPRVVMSDIVANREILGRFAPAPEANYFDPHSVGSIAESLASVQAARQAHCKLRELSVREDARQAWSVEVGNWLASLDLRQGEK